MTMLKVTIRSTNKKEEADIVFDKAVKQFKRLCNNDGFMMEIQERRYFKKPSEKKREDKNKSKKVFKKMKKEY